jgi:hypothetical protein
MASLKIVAIAVFLGLAISKPGRAVIYTDPPPSPDPCWYEYGFEEIAYSNCRNKWGFLDDLFKVCEKEMRAMYRSQEAIRECRRRPDYYERLLKFNRGIK